MDAVTYPHPAVTRELESWVFAKVDVSRYSAVAKAFGVPAVPEAVLVSPDGRILGRAPDFVAPEAFSAWLQSIRTGSDE